MEQRRISGHHFKDHKCACGATAADTLTATEGWTGPGICPLNASGLDDLSKDFGIPDERLSVLFNRFSQGEEE